MSGFYDETLSNKSCAMSQSCISDIVNSNCVACSFVNSGRFCKCRHGDEQNSRNCSINGCQWCVAMYTQNSENHCVTNFASTYQEICANGFRPKEGIRELTVCIRCGWGEKLR